MDIFSSLLCFKISELFKFRLISYDSYSSAIISLANQVLAREILRGTVALSALIVR